MTVDSEGAYDIFNGALGSMANSMFSSSDVECCYIQDSLCFLAVTFSSDYIVYLFVDLMIVNDLLLMGFVRRLIRSCYGESLLKFDGMNNVYLCL